MFVGSAAFFDASGSDSTSAIAVAGYVFTKNNALEFEKTWNELLKDAGIEYFRMTEFVNYDKQFAGWKDRRLEKNQLFEALTVLIKKWSDLAFGCVVLLEDYNAIDSAYELHERLWPYPLVGYTCIKQCHDWAILQRRMPIISYFECGDTHQSQLVKVTSEELSPELRPIFIPKRIAPLQAADIAAWDLGNIATKVLQQAEYGIWQKSYDRLRETLQDYSIYTREALTEFCVKTKVSPRKYS